MADEARKALRGTYGFGLPYAVAAVPMPDGTTLLASAGDDATIRLWNPTTGQPIGQPLTGHTGEINALATLPSPDGTTLLASASNDATIRLWDPTTGRVTVLFADVTTVGFSDRRARADSLDRGNLVTVLAGLLTGPGSSVPTPDKELPGPSVVAIEGPWGAGKTSLMGFLHDPMIRKPTVESGRRLTARQAYRLLRDTNSQAPPPREPATPVTWVPAWFNPWAHQSSEQIWAGLARAILDALGGVLLPSTVERERYWLARNAARLDPRTIQRTLRTGAASPWFRPALWALVVPIAARLADPTSQLYLFGNKLFSAATLALLLPLVLLGVAVGNTAWRWFRTPAAAYLPGDLLRGPVLSGALAQPAAERPEPLRDPLYHARSGYLYLYQHDIKELLDEAGDRGHRLVVFIDDLDRCGPQVTADVLGAVNLFLSEQFPHSRFVIGLDPVVVAAHIDQVYRDLPDPRLIAHEDDPSPGWTFLRKLVQLPVALPYVADSAVDGLLRAELGEVAGPHPPAPAAPGAPSTTSSTVDNAPIVQVEPTPGQNPPPSVTTAVPPRGQPATSQETDRDPIETESLATLTAALERSPQVRALLSERLLAQPSRSARETKRLVTVWQFYVRVLALSRPTTPDAAEERARHVVLLAEVVARWPALHRHLNQRVAGRHGLTLLVEAAPDDIAWARALRTLGLDRPEIATACRNLRALLSAYDFVPAAALATELM
ncbi:MAG TPA: P-loop NTPase fold protein [Micromonosporaceae bacterium]|nr:P-loop NTPase fold protein [Micromonosporaceae bacterium]